MDADFIDDLEASIAKLATSLTQPFPRECVICYVARMLDEFGCDGRLRWTASWRDLRVPAASALERRMQAKGGYCDCEIFLNAFAPRDRNGGFGNLDAADSIVYAPDCLEVSPRSSQPCALWRARYRNR